MKTYQDFITEAKMGVAFTPKATPVYSINDAKELVCVKPFKLDLGGGFTHIKFNPTWQVDKGDTIYNLPGGLFVKKKNRSDDPPLKSGEPKAVREKYGVHINQMKENLSAILKNCKKVK